MLGSLSQIIRASKNPLCFALGNSDNSDDAAGIFVGKKFEDVGIKLIEGGVCPENYLESVVRESPDLVIITDAVASDQDGDFILIDDIPLDFSASTHSIALSTLASYINKRSGATVLFLGINHSTKRDKINSFIEELCNEIHKSERA